MRKLWEAARLNENLGFDRVPAMVTTAYRTSLSSEDITTTQIDDRRFGYDAALRETTKGAPDVFGLNISVTQKRSGLKQKRRIACSQGF